MNALDHKGIEAARPILDRFTSRLLLAMRRKGMRAAPLARAASLNESAARDIFRGRSKNPGIRTGEALANALGLTLVDLIADEDSQYAAGLDRASRIIADLVEDQMVVADEEDLARWKAMLEVLSDEFEKAKAAALCSGTKLFHVKPSET